MNLILKENANRVNGVSVTEVSVLDSYNFMVDWETFEVNVVINKEDKYEVIRATVTYDQQEKVLDVAYLEANEVIELDEFVAVVREYIEFQENE